MSESLMSLIRKAGFQGQAANIMYAIVMAESGGNAKAHNPAGTDDSYGLAQINMLGGMGPERRRQFGLKTNADLFDPLTNLRVAFALSGGGKNFSPWTTYTRGTYKQFLGQSGAVVTAPAGASQIAPSDGGSAVATAPKLTSADYKEALGELSGLLTAVPELGRILKKAVDAGWAEAKFRHAVETSKWWRQHNIAARDLIARKISDPKEYTTRIEGAKNTVRNLAAQMGVKIGSPVTLNTLASMFLIQGWDQAELQHQLGGRINLQLPMNSGQAAGYYNELKQIYGDMAVPIAESSLRLKVRELLAGNQTIDTYKNHAVTMAKSIYPSIAEQIGGGMSVREIADPYIQTMAGLLELNPEAVKITDPTIKRALQGSTVTQGGKRVVQTYTLHDFENLIRQDPRWGYTKNAKDMTATTLRDVGRVFGFGPG